MKQYHHLQMRFHGEDVVPGMNLSFQGCQYTLGELTPQTLQRDDLPIGVWLTGYTRQHLLTKDGRPAGAAWFYFYRAFENKFWAVLDEIEVASGLPVCA